jgi:hypothetical protein
MPPPQVDSSFDFGDPTATIRWGRTRRQLVTLNTAAQIPGQPDRAISEAVRDGSARSARQHGERRDERIEIDRFQELAGEAARRIRPVASLAFFMHYHDSMRMYHLVTLLLVMGVLPVAGVSLASQPPAPKVVPEVATIAPTRVRQPESQWAAEQGARQDTGRRKTLAILILMLQEGRGAR